MSVGAFSPQLARPTDTGLQAGSTQTSHLGAAPDRPVAHKSVTPPKLPQAPQHESRSPAPRWRRDVLCSLHNTSDGYLDRTPDDEHWPKRERERAREWPMEVTHGSAYSSLPAPRSSQNLSVDPRLVHRHGPRPPGGLRFLKHHFPDRQSRGGNDSDIMRPANGSNFAGLLSSSFELMFSHARMLSSF